MYCFSITLLVPYVWQSINICLYSNDTSFSRLCGVRVLLEPIILQCCSVMEAIDLLTVERIFIVLKGRSKNRSRGPGNVLNLYTSVQNSILMTKHTYWEKIQCTRKLSWFGNFVDVWFYYDISLHLNIIKTNRECISNSVV